MMRRPGEGEHNPYYSTYIDKVPEGSVLEVLSAAPSQLERLLGGLTPEQQGFAYDEGKWSIREALGHVVDTERVFSYRALHIARSDRAPVPGMDQDLWAQASNAAARPLASLLAEFRAARSANVELFASFDEQLLDRRGIASGFEFTVRALIYIVAGHELHHRAVLAERYLAGLGLNTEAGDG